MLLYVPASNPILFPFALVPLLLDVSPASLQHRGHLISRMKKKKTTWSRVGFMLTWSKVPSLFRSWVSACIVPPPFPIVSGARRPSLDIPPMNAPCGRLAGGASPLTTHMMTAQCHTGPANLGDAWSGLTTATSARDALRDPLLPWSMS